MTFQWTPYALPFVIATLICGALAVHVSRHRASAAGPPFVLLMGAVTAWMFLECLLVLGADVTTKLYAARACFLAVVLVGPALLLVALRTRDPDTESSLVVRCIIWGVPIATCFVVIFDPVPGILYRGFEVDLSGPYPRRLPDRGFWYYVVIAHTYLLVAWASRIFVERTATSWLEMRVDGPVILFGVLVPWVTSSAFVMGIDLSPHISAVPFGFMVSAACLAWGFERSGLLGVVGIGRRLVVDAMGEGVLVVDRRHHLVDLNASARRILSLGAERLTARPLADVLVDHPRIVEAVGEFSGHVPSKPGEHEPRARDAGEIEIVEGGALRSYSLRVSPLCDHRGRELSRVLVLSDTTERRHAEAEVARESGYIRLIQDVAVAANEAESVEQALQSALTRICDGMKWAVGRVYLPATDGTSDLVAVGAAHVSVSTDFGQLNDDEAFKRMSTGSGILSEVYTTGKPAVVSTEQRVEESGTQHLLRDRFGFHAAVAMPVADGARTAAVMGFVAIEEIESRDEMLRVLTHIGGILGRVIERKRTEEQIRDLAFFDPLTGLANRQLFRQRLEVALVQARRRGRMVALLFVDLDRFKVINDSLGHSTGDAVLMQVSERFAACVRLGDLVARETEERTASISRLGGDEFTVLLTDLESSQDALIVSQRLIQCLEEPFTVGDHEVFTGASIGVALSPGDGEDAETLLRNADAAMYDAKSRGANRFEFYASAMNRESKRSLRLETLLRRALERGGLDIAYQPQRNARTGEVVGVEALLRWTDPEEGDIPPGEFIPIAERIGLIVPIGAWVLEHACQQARSWQLAGYRPVRVAVNVSGHQIRMGDFPETVRRILTGTELSPRWLELELTESAIESEDPATYDSLRQLREIGVSLALDDFGTGTSSLTHLRHFPMDRVKIDRSFVNGIPKDGGDVALTNAIIAMSHGLRCDVVAEGVETEAQAAFLTAQGCDELQGYLIGRPVSAKDVVRYLELQKTDDDLE